MACEAVVRVIRPGPVRNGYEGGKGSLTGPDMTPSLTLIELN